MGSQSAKSKAQPAGAEGAARGIEIQKARQRNRAGKITRSKISPAFAPTDPPFFLFHNPANFFAT
jgi:hypothetical protein